MLELPQNVFGDIEENTTPLEVSLEQTFNENIQEEIEVTQNEEKEIEEVLVIETNIGAEDYIEKARKILGDDFENISIEVDGETVSLEEYITDLDRLIEVLENKYNSEKEEIKKSSINVEKLSGISKDIVEIIAKGGNPSSLLKLQQDYIEPFNTIDLDTEDGQIEAVRTLETLKGRFSDDDIDILIEGYKTKGILEEKSKTAYDEIEKSYKAHIDKIKQEENTRLEQIQKAQKEFKKSVKTKFEELGFNDKTIKEYVNFSAEVKELENGAKATEMEIAYSKMRQDPEKAPLLAIFLKDTEKYNEIVSKKKVVEKQKEISKMVFKSKANNSNGGTKLANDKNNNSSPLFTIDLI